MESAAPMQGSFGPQTSSKRRTEPRQVISARSEHAARAMRRAATLQPPRRQFCRSASAFAEQTRSQNLSEPRATVGQAPRWVQPSRTERAIVQGPGDLLPRPTYGWIGQHAPKYSFRTPAKRCACPLLIAATRLHTCSSVAAVSCQQRRASTRRCRQQVLHTKATTSWTSSQTS